MALRYGLREDEIACLRRQNVDKEKLVLHITGKGGRYREVPLPADLAEYLSTSRQFLFTPSAAWRAGFRRTVAQATKALGIEISGVHRLRANFAQNQYLLRLADGKDDLQSRKEMSRLMGHNRIDVTYAYVPRGFSEA